MSTFYNKHKRVNHLVVDSSALIRQTPLNVCSMVFFLQRLSTKTYFHMRMKKLEKRIWICLG